MVYQIKQEINIPKFEDFYIDAYAKVWNNLIYETNVILTSLTIFKSVLNRWSNIP